MIIPGSAALSVNDIRRLKEPTQMKEFIQTIETTTAVEVHLVSGIEAQSLKIET